MLTHGANINAQDAEGNAPLHLAAQKGHAGFVEFLIAQHANQNVLNRAFRSFAAEALRAGHRDMLQHLVDAALSNPEVARYIRDASYRDTTR